MQPSTGDLRGRAVADFPTNKHGHKTAAPLSPSRHVPARLRVEKQAPASAPGLCRRCAPAAEGNDGGTMTMAMGGATPQERQFSCMSKIPEGGGARRHQRAGPHACGPPPPPAAGGSAWRGGVRLAPRHVVDRAHPPRRVRNREKGVRVAVGPAPPTLMMSAYQRKPFSGSYTALGSQSDAAACAWQSVGAMCWARGQLAARPFAEEGGTQDSSVQRIMDAWPVAGRRGSPLGGGGSCCSAVFSQ